jgi:hypothetical protein
VQIGYSAGARDVPSFDWVKNITRKISQEDRQKLDYQTSAAFALFWNMCRNWLPDCVISDIDQFVETTGLYSMDSNQRLGGRNGEYTIPIHNTSFTFSNAQLAPPTGVMAQNYAR